MTPADLRSKARRQARSLVPWLSRANTLIDDKVGDAAAHMANAVTRTLRDTPEGRRTTRKATSHPSTRAAVVRLGELLDALCGPSARSLDGLIRDAREAFYRESFEDWKPYLPGELWVSSDPSPTAAGVARCRGMTVHGTDVRRDLLITVERSLHMLVAAVAVAGRRSSTDTISSNVISGWAATARTALRKATATALSDSQVAADVLAGRDLVHPDFLSDIPVPVGA